MLGVWTGQLPPTPPLPSEFVAAQLSIGTRVRERRAAAAAVGPVDIDSDEDAMQDPDYRPSQG